MPCEAYKNALTEAALTGADPQNELRTHLATCAPCRAAFAQEQALFSSIDAGLHVTANADVPASLLPPVRARLDEGITPQPRWNQSLILGAASVGLAFAIFLFARPQHSKPDIQAKQTPQIPVNSTPVKNAQHPNSGPGTQSVSSNLNNSHKRSRSTLLPRVASSQPEVLVPPDEREAFARFVATLQEHSEVVTALAALSADGKGKPASLERLQIDQLEVKPLEATESQVSDIGENIR
jgi:hypothetical protein